MNPVRVKKTHKTKTHSESNSHSRHKKPRRKGTDRAHDTNAKSLEKEKKKRSKGEKEKKVIHMKKKMNGSVRKSITLTSGELSGEYCPKEVKKKKSSSIISGCNCSSEMNKGICKHHKTDTNPLLTPSILIKPPKHTPPEKKKIDKLEYFKAMVESKKSTKHVAKQAEGNIHLDVMPSKVRVVNERTRGRKEKKQPLGTADNFDNNGKIFEDNGLPFWAVSMWDAAEAGTVGVGEEGRLTSDHVLQFLDGSLGIAPPTYDKPVFDYADTLDNLMMKDDIYFAEGVVIYNSLKNVVENSHHAVERCTNQTGDAVRLKPAEAAVDQVAEDDTRTIRFQMDKTLTVRYDRVEPRKSIRTFMRKMKEQEEKEDIGVEKTQQDM